MAYAFAAVRGTLIIRNVCRPTVDKWNAMQLAAVQPTATSCYCYLAQTCNKCQTVIGTQSTAAQRSTAGHSIFLGNNLAKYTKSFLVPPSRKLLHRTSASFVPQNEGERLLSLELICTALRSLKCGRAVL